MKRLLDETTDDFTRALLVAGIGQRPPAGNKRKVLVALGAGGALGLFSSQALAWLGTSGGKLSLFGVALGVAGAAYAVAPGSGSQGPGATALPSASRGGGSAPAPVAPAAAVPGAAVPAAPAKTGSSAVARRVADAHASAAAESVPTAAKPGLAATAASPARRSRPAAAAPRAERDAMPELAEPARESLPGASATQSSKASKASARQLSIASATQPSMPSLAESVRGPRLDSEVRLVDDMHAAVRRNDHEALARFVEAYRASFPDGQLQAEVADLAARLQRTGAR